MEGKEMEGKELEAIAAMQDLIAKFGFAHAINALDRCIQDNPDANQWEHDGFSPLLEMVAEQEGVLGEITVLSYLLETDDDAGLEAEASDEGDS